ncbi:MAG: Gfo/Idh/MocA family protein [Burkholderiales bacterium]
MSGPAAEAARIDVAVIGLGVGEQHAMAWSRETAVGRVWLVDLDPERAREVCSRVERSAVAGSYANLLGDPRVAAVSIASFDDDHFAQACAALEAGKHVFVEKPLCRSLAEAERLHALWRAAAGRLHLDCNLVLRAAPLYVWLRERIADGALGDLFAVDGDYLYGRLAKITAGWRRDVNDYSVMQGGGIHLIDLLLRLSGERPRSVVANGNRISTRGSGFRYDDFRAATFQFDSGLIGRITANFGCVHPHQHVLRVFGTRATFIHDDAGARLLRSRDPGAGAEKVGHAPLPAGKGALIADFLARALAEEGDGGETQLCFDGICAAIAADRAARSGAVETIEYL